MAISKITAERISETIRQWQRDFDISDAIIRSLLRRLADVDGNKSYADTISCIAEAYES